MVALDDVDGVGLVDIALDDVNVVYAFSGSLHSALENLMVDSGWRRSGRDDRGLGFWRKERPLRSGHPLHVGRGSFHAPLRPGLNCYSIGGAILEVCSMRSSGSP